MPNFASLTIIGHLGRAAEATAVGQTTKVSFSIATSRKRKDTETTTWWNCTYWGDRAAKVCQYLDKGKAVCVQGEVWEREYQAKDGSARKALEVEVRELVLLGDRGQREAAPEQKPAPTRTRSDLHEEPPPF